MAKAHPVSAPLEDLVTGFGVIAAAEAAIGSLDGFTLALKASARSAGKSPAKPSGAGPRSSRSRPSTAACTRLDIELLFQLRSAHGDAFVHHAGFESKPDPAALFDVPADVLVPGARTGVITPNVAERLQVRWIAPASKVPYAATATEALKTRGIRFLADYICGADTPGDVFREVKSTVTNLVTEASVDPGGSYAGACRIANDSLPPGGTRTGCPTGLRSPEGRPLVEVGGGLWRSAEPSIRRSRRRRG